ncbi:MAG: homocysteine S-methyltransferase family protein [Firmicutes bacterium]|nr:homocysteine S-methyltransferase family protein [Bacillota bacterium]MBR3706985.1 homocysteine S-methyltransferase family protein [Bacillota bacterium]MBR6584455.1 homocysteine S-methyltransferase family protein [Bacillota bacterium]
MKYNILEELGKRMLFFDGGMGTMLQKKGVKPGEITEIWNITRPADVYDVHCEYLSAGADIIMANTFGANAIKLEGTGYTVDEIVKAGVANAQRAVLDVCGPDTGRKAWVAMDLAPTGKLLKPFGTMEFDAAYELYKEMVIAGADAGADIMMVETMGDTYEIKAAILAIKENCDLPVFATVTFDEKGKLLTGANVEAVVTMLEGLGADAIGINCGLGPVQMRPLVQQMLSLTSLPVIVNPNAGLPRQEGDKTVYDITPEQFADVMEEMAADGVWLMGGCCGTTPEYIRLIHDRCVGKRLKPITKKEITRVSSYSHAVNFEDGHVIIGERINPTGKSRFKQALRDGDIDYVLQEGFAQEDAGAKILDVNVGLPEIDEEQMLYRVMTELQAVIDLPLQIDTADINTMETALRYYNGKAMINSVNGKRESMDAIFPLVKKYGGVVVGLTLDEKGIPETAAGRLEIARKIVDAALYYGIKKEDIIIDVLCMTISSDHNSAQVTLDALELVKKELGVKTSLGVSNISFGLPARENINANFYTMALQRGLDAAIINPKSRAMMTSYYAYNALAGKDPNCSEYIANYADAQTAAPAAPAAGGESMSLEKAVERGMKEAAHAACTALIASEDPLEIINGRLIPVLDQVGKGFEAGTVFLPQLLMSAEAAKAAFAVIREEMLKTGGQQEDKGKIVIATVKGDIHDIGKNIVKVLLENYGYKIIDLGKDVAPETIVEAVVKEDVKLVGLSALMTTTVGAMEETIKALAEVKPDCKVMVGGAVLTEQYADMIRADKYVRDAMASVHFAQEVLG